VKRDFLEKKKRLQKTTKTFSHGENSQVKLKSERS